MEKTKGGVTIKTIAGRKYYYYQWYEGRKKRSKIITESEYLSLRDKVGIEGGQIPMLPGSDGIAILRDGTLRNAVSRATSYKKRDCFSILSSFLKTPPNGRVLILYGLRRTGKTTLIYQAIGEMNEQEFDSSAYLIVNERCTIGRLNQELDKLAREGIKNVFIDEVTLIDGFIESANFLSDYYGRIMNIVLSGTDSLGFYISTKEALFDRATLVHTTYIPFFEFSRVLGINDIDTYIEYGGTMTVEGVDYHIGRAPIFYDENNAISYIDSAIARNIERSLSGYRDGYGFERLKGLKEKGELTSLINRVIADINHRFTAEALSKEFRSHDYGSLKNLIRKAGEAEELRLRIDELDEKQLYQDLMEALDILKPAPPVDQETADELRAFLKELDIIAEVKSVDVETGQETNKVVFTQPGIRYCQAKVLVGALLCQPKIISLPEKLLDLLFAKLMSDVKGRMMEEIVLLEAARFGSKKTVKAMFHIGEIDMVIYDSDTNACEAFEIKHSDKIDASQARFLVDPEICKELEKRYGRIAKKTVLYRGAPDEKNGVFYENVSSFLTSAPWVKANQ